MNSIENMDLLYYMVSELFSVLRYKIQMDHALFLNMKTCEFKTNLLFIYTVDQYLNH